MAAADYALCDSCNRKVFYDADTDIPVGTVILHVECAIKENAAAVERGRQQGWREAVEALRGTEVWRPDDPFTGLAPFGGGDLCQHDRYNKGQPTLMVQASAHGSGGGVAWEFEVVEVDIDGPTVEVKLFSDAFAAFAQIPEFFANLADQGTWATLDGVRSLLDGMGAVDETDRADG